MTTCRDKYVDHIVDLPFEIKALGESDGVRRIRGIATTPSIDRMGDVILPEGAQFQLPIPLLWQHNPDYPIGNVVSARVGADGIEVEAIIAPDGELSAIDNHWRELKNGLVRCFSIGFRGLDSKPGKSGRIFTKWDWLELSCVTIPANPDCLITAVKAYSVPAREPPRAEPTSAGAPAARTAPPAGTKTMPNITVAERISSAKSSIARMQGELNEIVAVDDIDEARAEQIGDLSARIENEQRGLTTLQAAERALAAQVANGERPAPATVPVTQRSTNQNAPVYVSRQRDTVKGDLVFKTATAYFLAHAARKPLDEVLRMYYGGNQQLETYVRTVSNPATTTTVGWAAELVANTTADFLDALVGESLYAALTARGNRFTFGRAGKITVPGRGGTGKELAGDWVGEGAPIPVKQGVITSAVLIPHKLAVISTFTRELAQHSTPQIEALIRQMILEDTAEALDKYLFDNVVGGGARPSGLLAGVTAIPSSGNTAANIVTDLKALLQSIIGANGGRRLAFVMNPVHTVGLGLLMTASGEFLFQNEVAAGNLLGYPLITSTHMPVGTVVLIDLAEFASATDDAPAFDVSDVATLHMDSDVTTVAPIVDGAGAVAQPVRSLWQTASVGVRMIQDVSWTMRRSGMIAALSGVAW